MRLSVHGSRTLKDERVQVLILEEWVKHGATALVTHGEPLGVCGVARDLAKQQAWPLHLHFLNFARRRGAWEHRCHAVLADSDHALFIWDGASKGCANEMAHAIKRRLPHTLHKLDLARGPSQSFENDADWAGVLGQAPR